MRRIEASAARRCRAADLRKRHIILADIASARERKHLIARAQVAICGAALGRLARNRRRIGSEIDALQLCRASTVNQSQRRAFRVDRANAAHRLWLAANLRNRDFRRADVAAADKRNDLIARARFAFRCAAEARFACQRRGIRREICTLQILCALAVDHSQRRARLISQRADAIFANGRR